jgi:hypothetical protein
MTTRTPHSPIGAEERRLGTREMEILGAVSGVFLG